MSRYYIQFFLKISLKFHVIFVLFIQRDIIIYSCQRNNLDNLNKNINQFGSVTEKRHKIFMEY